MKITKSSPSLTQHPLMGVHLPNLLRILNAYGGVSSRSLPHLLAFTGSAIGRLPFQLLEQWKTRNLNPHLELEAPVFIVGYWRSGTTHLHNLLGQSPGFGIITPLASGLPGELLTLATWLKPLLEKGLPDDRGVDEVAVTPDSPQEDEIPVANLQKLSVFHALYFGKNFRKNFLKGLFFDNASEKEIDIWRQTMLQFLAKVARHQHVQPLLIKNPVYTARIDRLLNIWPDARFIHIYRNPYTVYHSTLKYYHNMLHSLSLQAYNEEEIEPVIQQSYPRMLDKLYTDTGPLSPYQFAEVRYEDLDSDPLSVLERLYRQLDLPAWKEAQTATESYLHSIADYSKNPHRYEPDLKEKVDRYWGKFVEKWDYDFPSD